jgi:hypothetical protein
MEVVKYYGKTIQKGWVLIEHFLFKKIAFKGVSDPKRYKNISRDNVYFLRCFPA